MFLRHVHAIIILIVFLGFLQVGKGGIVKDPLVHQEVCKFGSLIFVFLYIVTRVFVEIFGNRQERLIHE